MEYTGNLLTMLNPVSLLGGVTTMLVFMTHGCFFVALKTDGAIRHDARALGTKIGLAAAVAAEVPAARVIAVELADDAVVAAVAACERYAPGRVRVVQADAAAPSTLANLDGSVDERPVPGDPVTAGTVATDSGLRVQITATGDDTALAGIQRLVADAQNSTSRAQRLADSAAALLFWFALGAAAITAIVAGQAP